MAPLLGGLPPEVASAVQVPSPPADQSSKLGYSEVPISLEAGGCRDRAGAEAKPQLEALERRFPSPAVWVPVALCLALLGALVQTWPSLRPVEGPRLVGPRPATTSTAGPPAARHEEVCSEQARLPVLPASHRWEVGGSTDACLNGSAKNLCWDRMKRMCHSNLKSHMSWGTMEQELRADGRWLAGDESFSPLEQPHLCDKPEHGQPKSWTRETSSEAHTWFRAHVQVFVLNLPSGVERWKMISERLDHLRIGSERVEGLDMREENAIGHAQRAGWVRRDFNFSHAQEVAYSTEEDMGSILGTLGCAAAHFKAQDHIVSNGSKPLAVVFEDDVWPEDDFVERLWALVLEELPCDWEVVSLMSRCPYGHCVSKHLARVQPDVNEPAQGCRHGVNWGMQGMLYRRSALADLRERWQRTVFDETRPRCLDVDVALASISDKVRYYAVPSVQDPGFLRESNHRSARWDINVAAASAGQTTSTRKPSAHKMHQMIGRPWTE